MAKLTTATSTAVIDVPDELVARYEAGGWVSVEKQKPTRKPAEKSDKN